MQQKTDRRNLARRITVTVVALVIAVAATLAVYFQDELRSRYSRWRYPRIVLVTFDTLAVGFTGPYNSDVEFTPHLSALAAEGVVFFRAYTTVPITLPSHASLLAGKSPAELGVMVNGDEVQDWIETLPEMLQQRGYRTAAFTSLGVLQSEFNLDQGFDFYDRSAAPRNLRWYRTADEVFESARQWISENAEEPFFVWVHFSDPHEPYVLKSAPPDAELTLDGEVIGQWNLTTKERQVVQISLPPGSHELTWSSIRPPREDDRAETSLRLALFKPEGLAPWLSNPPADLTAEKDLSTPFTLELENGKDETISFRVGFTGRTGDPGHSEVWENYQLEVEYSDRYFGELREYFRALEKDQGTLWVVVSDHGEGLFRQGALGHASYSYEDQLRILWMMSGPGIPQGKIIEDDFVVIEDVLPTILDLLRLGIPGDLSGLSQRGCWRRSGCAERDEWWAYGVEHDADGTPRISAVAGYQPPLKVMWRQRRSPRFFNLLDDPWEEENLGTIFKNKPQHVPPEFKRLTRELGRKVQHFEGSLERRSWMSLDAEKQELLRSLGYLGN